MLKHSTYLLLALSALGCSSSEIPTLPVDRQAAISFATRVTQRYVDYADSSEYQPPPPQNPLLRGFDAEPCILYRPEAAREDVVIYTFDRSDSCVIWSDAVPDQLYLFRILLVPIPTGRYLLKFGHTTVDFDRP
jgi:hypothetical protein